MPYIHTKDDFERLVLPGPKQIPGQEGLHLDFKRDRNTRNVQGKSKDSAHLSTALDIAAFANAAGGVLVFGVDEDDGKGNPEDKGKAKAVVPDLEVEATMRHVEESISNHTYGFDQRPPAQPLNVDGRTVVVVNVHPSPRLIYVVNGQRTIHCPIRHTFGNGYLKPEEIRMRLDARYPTRFRWILAEYLRSGSTKPMIRLVHIRRGGTLDDFSAGYVLLQSVSETGALLTFKEPEAQLQSDFEIPYEWIVSVWQHQEPCEMSHVPRPAIMVSAYIRWASPEFRGTDGLGRAITGPQPAAIEATPMPWP